MPIALARSAIADPTFTPPRRFRRSSARRDVGVRARHRRQRPAREIINQLRVNMLVRTKHAQARTFRRSKQLRPLNGIFDGRIAPASVYFYLP